jgi:osmotically-inducible protein OsmY
MSQTKDIRDAVERELSYDPLVDDSAISVKNINGDVALNGTVPSYPQYLEAAAAARRRRTTWRSCWRPAITVTT